MAKRHKENEKEEMRRLEASLQDERDQEEDAGRISSEWSYANTEPVDVEAASELAEPVRRNNWRERRKEGVSDGRTMGIIALVLSLISFFLLPFLFGSVGIILGVFAAARGSRIGWWALALSIIAIALSMFITPIMRY
ncbi:DUF308 domain-containing protein [Polycladomyces subterraneus]|uniref:DUF308 domain-containing protein n=1 Tax=Polycladomyces subterraneus TaxID=1016997 RepID=A0ABT8IS04_9BACL|nr:DUF308 domain-containing protein [Polycladomyces subterraneus]MDN4594854.1 DUF308 domain-containing protein [Polycladomyces subterraneus]